MINDKTLRLIHSKLTKIIFITFFSIFPILFSGIAFNEIDLVMGYLYGSLICFLGVAVPTHLLVSTYLISIDVQKHFDYYIEYYENLLKNGKNTRT